MASTERKQNIGCDENILYPVDYTTSKHKSTYNFDTSLALTTPFSGGLDLDELSEKVKSFMEKTQKKAQNSAGGFLYICNVCGKEGLSIHIQNHIEANHLEGVSLPCKQCDKTAKSTTELTEHNHRHHATK